MMTMRVFLVALCALLATSVYAADQAPGWGYDDASTELLGPSFWAQGYPKCGEDFQSPINILTTSTQHQPSYGALNVSYSLDRTLDLKNNGHTTVVSDLDGQDYADDIIFANGLLPGQYRLAQFHFHWGQNDNSGSEHTVDHLGFPAELHLVHYNTKFASLTDAVASGERNALAVIGVFYKVGSRTPDALREIVKHLGEVDEPEEDAAIAGPIDLRTLLPEHLDYYTYQGSLTTPACNQIVQWIVLRYQKTISRKDLNILRSTLLEVGPSTSARSTDFRPVQPLNDRIVYTSFLPGSSYSAASTVVLSVATVAALAVLALFF